MMTPQEAASSTFPKATIGGYNMAAVDVFLDKLTEDYTTLYKENAALKAKIKVLVDKMEEYHSMEDTMRSTLLTAQKMANTMMNEAEEKSAALVAEGEAAARKRIAELENEVAAEKQRLEAVRAEIDKQIEAEHARLAAAQNELGSFLSAYRKLCEKQLEFIDRLPGLELLPKGFTVSEPQPEAPLAAAAPAETTEVPAVPASETTEATDPVDDAEAAAALAEVVEELGGDASSLMKSMQDVIDSFAGESSEEETATEDDPFRIDFEDMGNPFEEKSAPETDVGDPFAEETEDENATRVINLDDLQFGRNYTKD